MAELGRGYIDRDYKAEPFGSQFEKWDGERFRPSQWDELRKIQIENRCGAFEIHTDRKTKNISQGSWPYCWQYGFGIAMRATYQMAGMNPWPDLNPFSTAYLGKRGAKRGGYGTEAARYVKQFGMATHKRWPTKRKQPMNSLLKKHMARYKHLQFVEFERGDIEGAISAMLHPTQPMLLTAGYSDISHLMCLMTIEPKTHALWHLNSWGNHRNSDRVPQGFYRRTLRQRKPFELVGIRSMKWTTEAE